MSAGDYLVSVFGADGGEIGTYSLSLQVDDPAPSGDPPVPLVLGDAISDSLEAPTDVSLFLLTLDVESEILAELTLDAAFDGVITIYRGEASSDTTIANLVVTADAASEGESETLKQPLTSGTYVVLINSFESASSGVFALTVTAEPAVLTLVTRGETTEGELSIFGEVDLYTVSEMETITATLEGSFDAILFLYSGSTVADVLDSSNLLKEADDPEVITRTLEAGAYTLIVSSFGRSETGAYTLQLETTGGSSAPATDFDGRLGWIQ